MKTMKNLMSATAMLGSMTSAEMQMGRYMRDGEGHPTKSTEQLAAQVKEQFAKSFDVVKEVAEKALAEATKNGELNTALKADADEALLKMNGLNEQFSALEQKIAEDSTKGADIVESAGQQMIESDKFKEFVAQPNPRGKVDFETKANLTSLTTDAGGSVGDGIVPTRQPGIQPLPQRRLTIRDLLTPGRMDGSLMEYAQETGFTNAAAPVAEGAAKPQSDIQLDLLSTSAKVIAHYMKASRQVLSDVNQLKSIIDQRLLFGLKMTEEAQLLNGDGTGQNLLGIIPQATAYSAPITLSSPTSIDVMRLAMLQAALAEFPATGHVMNPVDWAWIETMKDTDGHYLIGNPQGSLAPTLWNLPVVTTQAMTVDKFLTGAFKLGAQIFDRWDARVEVATENEDDFIKNMVTVLCEERLALAVYRPEAFIYGDFGRVA